MPGETSRIEMPREARRGEPVRAEDFNLLRTALRRIEGMMWQRTPLGGTDVGVRMGARGFTPFLKQKRGGGSGGLNRFGFGGLFQDEEEVWRVRILEGVIIYHQIVSQSDFDRTGHRAPRFSRGIYPQVDGVRIDDASGPGLVLGALETATVWLVCREERCHLVSSLDSERLEITARGEEPEIEGGEVAIQIVDFDIETDEESGTKQATNIYRFLQSDWEQPFLCDEDNSQDDSESGSEFGSSHGGFPGDGSSGSGGSSDSEEEPDGPCQVKMSAGWDNGVACFPKDPTMPEEFCVAKPYRFEVKVQFYFKQPFGGVPCTAIAYGVRMDGGIIENPPAGSTTTEYRWRNDTARELVFYVEDPPACGTITLHWRVRTFGPASGFGGEEPEEDGCCNQDFSGSTVMTIRDSITTGPFNPNKTKLPEVCGCTCSSAVIDSSSGA